MGKQKSYDFRIMEQELIIKKALEAKKQLEKDRKKAELEQKQKKIESMMKDIEKALQKSPALSYSKSSPEYKALMETIKTGFPVNHVQQIIDPAPVPDPVPAPPAKPTIYEQIGRIAEHELGRPLVEGDQTYFADFIQAQDRRGLYFKNAFPQEEV